MDEKYANIQIWRRTLCFPLYSRVQMATQHWSLTFPSACRTTSPGWSAVQQLWSARRAPSPARRWRRPLCPRWAPSSWRAGLATSTSAPSARTCPSGCTRWSWCSPWRRRRPPPTPRRSSRLPTGGRPCSSVPNTLRSPFKRTFVTTRFYGQPRRVPTREAICFGLSGGKYTKVEF